MTIVTIGLDLSLAQESQEILYGCAAQSHDHS